MNIRKQLQARLSKENAEFISSYVGQDRARFKQLISSFTGDDPTICNNAAMAVSKCVDKYPHLIEPHIEDILLNLKRPTTDGVKRNTARIMQKAAIPEPLLGIAADVFFNLLANRREAVAIRVFSMTVLYNICELEPDLSNELKILIEDQMPDGSTGFKNRGAKILHKLSRLS